MFRINWETRCPRKQKICIQGYFVTATTVYCFSQAKFGDFEVLFSFVIPYYRKLTLHEIKVIEINAP